MRLRLGLMLGAVEGVSVQEVALVAGQKLGTHWHQFWCEGELLAVEDEEVSVFIDSSLHSSGSPLESLASVLLVADLIIGISNVFVILFNASDIFGDTIVTFFVVVIKAINLVVKIDKSFSENFKADHDTGLLLESHLVLFLRVGFFTHVHCEVIDFVPEVTGWYIVVLVVKVWIDGVIAIFMRRLVSMWVAIMLICEVINVVSIVCRVVVIVLPFGSVGRGDQSSKEFHCVSKFVEFKILLF